MTTPYRIALLLVTGTGALLALVRAESIFCYFKQPYFMGNAKPPSSEEFIVYAAVGTILTLIFLVLGSSIVYRCYFRKR